MKRLLLLCLLLSACAPKDPPGTLIMQARTKASNAPSIFIEKQGRGETVPLRLPKGDRSIMVFGNADAMTNYGCSIAIDLVEYDSKKERRIFQSDHLLIERFRVNAVESGLYFLKINISESYCTADILIE